MSRCPDLANLHVGRLTVLHRIENEGRRSRWHCLCACGKTVDVLGQNLTRKDKPTTSCGCLVREVVVERFHRMRAARNTQLVKQREARLAGAKPLTDAERATERRRRNLEQQEARWKTANEASIALAHAWGYPTGAKP